MHSVCGTNAILAEPGKLSRRGCLVQEGDWDAFLVSFMVDDGVK